MSKIFIDVHHKYENIDELIVRVDKKEFSVEIDRDGDAYKTALCLNVLQAELKKYSQEC